MVNIDLASFSFDTSEILAGAAEIKRTIDQLKAEQKELAKSGDTASEAFVQNAADLKTLNGFYNEHIKFLSETTKGAFDAATREAQLEVVLAQEATTIKELRDQNKLLNKLRNDTNVTTDEGKAQLLLLNEQLDKNNELIKANVDEYTKQKINIGNYTKSIKQAFEEMQKEKKALEESNKALMVMQEETEKGSKEWSYFNQQIQQNNQQINILVTSMGGVNDEMQASTTITNLLRGNFSGLATDAQKLGGAGNLLTSTLKGVGASIMTVVKASLAFIATPIGAVIAAVGLVLGAIVGYLKSTQSGMDAVTKVTRPLVAIFESLVGVLQDVGKWLFEAFTNPKKSLEDIYNFVKKNLITTFEGLYDIIVGIATLDFAQAKKGFKTLGDQAKENIDLVKDAATQVGEFFDEAIQKGLELDRLEKELEQVRINNTIEIGKQAELFKEQNKIAEDTNKTLAEREAAVTESIAAAGRLNALKQQELDLEIAILKNKQSRNDTSREEELQLAELVAKKNELNAQELEMTTTQQNKLNTIRRQANAKANAEAQKALDQRLKTEDEKIALFEQQQLDGRAKTLQQELMIEKAISEMRLKQLDNELKAKKISQLEYAREVLAISQDLARKEAETAVDAASRELEAYKQSYAKQLEEKRFLSDQVLLDKTNELNALLLKEQEFAKLQFEQGLINQQEFNDAINVLNEQNRIAVKELEQEREAVEKQEAIELRSLEFEAELERLLEEGATKFEIEQAQINEQFNTRKAALDESLRNQEISQELYTARLEQLQRQRTAAEIANEKALAEEKLALATGLFDAAASFIDKDSKAGKAIALAKAGINMYQGISAGVALGLPAAIPAVAFATSTGLKTIKDIVSTKVPSASGSGSVGGGGFSANLATNLTGQGVNLSSSSNANVQDQVENNANLGSMTEQIANAVQQGAMQGTQQGSQEGLTNLSANQQIMQQSSF